MRQSFDYIYSMQVFSPSKSVDVCMYRISKWAVQGKSRLAPNSVRNYYPSVQLLYVCQNTDQKT